MELKDLGDEKLISAIIRRAKRGPFIDNEKAQEFLERINERYEKGLTLKQLRNLLTKTQSYIETVDEIFNVDTGLISGFRFDKKFPNEMSLSSRPLILPTAFAQAVKNVRTIEPSVQVIQNKENILEAFEDAKSYRPNRNIGILIPPEAFETLDRIASTLDIEVDEDVQFKKPADFASITSLLKTLTEITKLSTEDRDNYYDYWAQIEEKFTSLEKIETMQEQLAEGRFQFEDVAEDKEDPKTKKLREQLQSIGGEKTILPSYILEFKPIRIKEYPNAVKSIILLNEYLSSIGKALPEQYKNLLPNQQIASQIETTAQFNPETGEVSPEVDPDLIDELKDAIDALEEMKEDVLVDPVFALINRNTGGFNVDEETIVQLRKLLKEQLSYSELDFFAEEMQELLDDDIETFIKKFEDRVTSSSNRFYMPVMDSSDVVSFFNSIGGLTISVNYFQNGVVRSKTFTEYGKAVKFVNENSIKFFKMLSSVLKIQERRASMLSNPKTGKRENTNIAFRGGQTIPTSVKAPKMDEDVAADYRELLDIIDDYYNKPLNSSYVIREDVPNFFDDKSFRDIPVLLSRNPITLTSIAMLQGIAPSVSRQDYLNIINLLTSLENPDDLVYTDLLNDKFEDALDSYVKFWALVAVVAKDGEFDLIELRDEALIILGDVLYEVAKETVSDSELNRLTFAGEPIKFLNEEMSSKNIQIRGLLPLLGQEEWKTYVKNLGEEQKGLKRAYERLLNLLKESDVKLAGDLTLAMLEANDMLRKMQGLKISMGQRDIMDIEDLDYIISKIRKEHNVDLYGVDIYKIVKSQSSFNDVANTFGLSPEIIYKIKGMFR